MLAEIVEELKPQLVRRLQASGTEATNVRLPAIVDQLVRSLRQGRADLAPCSAHMRIGLDLEALLATVRLLRKLVYDLIEERDLTLSARDTRVLADWFAAVNELAQTEQNRRLGSLLDALPDHVVLKDRDGRVVYANRSAQEALGALGIATGDVIGKKASQLRLSPSFVRQAEADTARALAGETIRSEVRFPSEGGRWREHHASPVFAADGTIEAVAVASRDIHARKTAEARLELLSKVSALAESMEYESILSAVARLAIPHLAEWCIVDVVENGQRRRGAFAHRDPEKASLIEKLVQLTPELRDTQQWQEVLAGRSLIVTPRSDETLCGGAKDDEVCQIIRKLEARSALIVPFVVLGSTVAVATFVMTADSGRGHEPEDLSLAEELARRAGQIIENARLHQELRRSETRFRIALKHAKVAVFEEDTDFRIRWMYGPQLGVVADALVGELTAERLLPEEAAKVDALKRQLLITGEGVRVELHPLHPAGTGERPHVIFHYEPLRDASGAIVGIAGAGVDVTDEKQAQEELAEALAFREQMMGVLGHDLRNPLGAVRGLSSLLLLQNEIPDKARKGLQRIDQAARRMTEMIETLLDFTHSRFSGSLPVARQPVDLVEVARNVVEELRVNYPGREIRLAARQSVLGEWDPARMAQVVSNLVGNALTHGAADAPVELSLEAGGANAVLSVTNRGPAIPPELIGRLFEPFRRGSANGDGARARGLGLGLYIVREIVKAHGGSVSVESNGDATVFSVHLGR